MHADHGQDGNNKVPGTGLAVVIIGLIMLMVHGIFDNTVAFFVVLEAIIGTLHSTHLGHNAHDEQRHNGQRKNTVEDIGDNLHIGSNGVAVAQGFNGVLLVEHAAKEDGPGGKGNEHAGGRAGGIHHIGQSLTGNISLVRQLFGTAGDGQNIHIVIDIDNHAQNPGRQKGSSFGFTHLAQNIGNGVGSIGFVDNRNQAAEETAH